jgi:hypothetical protein
VSYTPTQPTPAQVETLVAARAIAQRLRDTGGDITAEEAGLLLDAFAIREEHDVAED